ncbi:MAG TPA: ATP-binding protein [Polyangia bacterium]|jgi:signal transduction histidine kinase/ActR/RegA family two-component response regulator
MQIVEGAHPGGRGVNANRLLVFARTLLRATDFAELLTIARDEIRASVGYKHAWFMVADDEAVDELRLIQVSGDRADVAWEVAPLLKVAGDPYLEALRASDGPIVIEDARADPRTNKQLVQQLGNRTLVNIPLRLLDKPFGLLGVGTFGDEGCRAPSPDELEHLVGLANHIVVAAGRIRFVEAREQARKEKMVLERRLLQLQKLESLGTLAGVVAHDFNDLLTVILSSAAFVEAGLRAEGERGHLQQDVGSISAAASRARDLTQKLLAMSRQQELELAPLDLNQRLLGLLNLLERMLPKTIAVDFIRGANLPFCDGDGAQLDQAFLNLCANAREAMPQGGRLTVETEQVLVNGVYAATHPWAKPGRYVLITVTDTGAGISPEIIDRVFEPFFTTKTEAGAGLGLSIAYGIIRQHGGMLQCYSEPGVGSSFKVYLPAQGRLVTSVGNKLVGSVPRAEGQERILVAEDDDSVRAVTVRILERAGYEVVAVDSGDAAVERAKEEAFDLFILDVVMPGMPCRQVVERIRLARPGTRLLLASGYTAGTNVIEWLPDAGIELLRKPYDPDHLLFSVRRALDDARVPAPA